MLTAGPGASVRGFTLIELLVTFTLLALLLTVGFPAFSAWIRNAQVRTVTDALQTGIRTGQAEAVRLNRGTVLFLTDDTPGITARASNGGRKWSLQTIPRVAADPKVFLAGGSLTDVAAGTTIAARDAGGVVNALCFNSDGFLFAPADPGAPGAVCASRDTVFDVAQASGVAGVDRPLRVLVSPGGRLRVCDPQRALAAAPDGCP